MKQKVNIEVVLILLLLSILLFFIIENIGFLLIMTTLVHIVVIVVFFLALINIFRIRVFNKDTKSGNRAKTKVVKPKAKKKTETEIREPALTEIKKELAILNERLARLEELYKRGEVEEEAYKILKEEYENKKKEIKKTMKDNEQKKTRKRRKKRKKKEIEKGVNK